MENNTENNSNGSNNTENGGDEGNAYMNFMNSIGFGNIYNKEKMQTVARLQDRVTLSYFSYCRSNMYRLWKEFENVYSDDEENSMERTARLIVNAVGKSTFENMYDMKYIDDSEESGGSVASVASVVDNNGYNGDVENEKNQENNEEA